MNHALQGVATDPSAYYLKEPGVTYEPNAWSSAWQPLVAGSQHNPMGVDLFAMVFGLGFVLSFGYWCTNFLVVQRAMAARNMTAARNTPLVAAVPKMLFPALVIVPGMIAIALTSMPEKNYRIPPPIVSEEAYAKAVTAVKAASPAEADAGVKAVADALGKKVDAQKVAVLIASARDNSYTDDQIKSGLYNSISEYDYDGVIISLVKRYCPTGLLGLALTALLASFMSGMAGNVTAFNTVWTYDLYQAYMAPNKSDQHYFRMGQGVTVVGILLSVACAYFASMYNNAMDIIQLVFGFVNAPLFATFLLGMFWARTTGTGAFLGLFGGIACSAAFHGLTIASGNVPGIKGGWLCGIGVSATFLVLLAIFAAVFGAILIHVSRGEGASETRKRIRFAHALINVVAPVLAGLSILVNWRPAAPKQFPSEMAQNFWLASFAFIACFALTVLISLATRSTKTKEELKGLVYSLTPKIKDEQIPWYQRPAVVGTILIIACVILNIIFW
jgi:SSS family solute:Na+ symporter